ncbi:MAG TPA: hypothetical protein VM533_06345 [Fimbriiglobus sp.]|jgi:hypothetical protein|nr:hypothetical protein [Fimbriiglobus sp.]
MTRLALPVVLMLAAVPAAAQQPDGKANREAIKKLDFLAGKWKGDATFSRGKDTQSITQAEVVEYRLGGTVLLIEGTGTGKLPGQDKEGVVFNALAVVSFDAKSGKYSIKAYRAEGQSVDAALTLSDGGKGFAWGFQEPTRGTQVRYVMTLTDKGQWHEVGEYSTDGKAWTKFIEMTLTRVKE